MTIDRWTVEDGGERLDRFLAARIADSSRSQVAEWIAEGKATVNGATKKASYSLRPGEEVVLVGASVRAPHDLTPADLPVKIRFEDESMLVVVKPRGVATHPAPGLKEATLVNALLGMNADLSEGSEAFRPGIVHRLDKETTGLLMVAKTDVAHRELARQIAAKTAERRYLGLCHGEIPRQRLRIEAPMARDPRDRRKMRVDPDGKNAVTHIKLLSSVSGQSLFAARLETGRTHQIRVHLFSIGHPLIGDSIYSPARIAEGPLQLHAGYLEFDHPLTRERMAFYEPPPEDFQAKIESDALSIW